MPRSKTPTRNDAMNDDPIRGTDAADRLLTVMRYHQQTKHHFSRYARSPGHLDWANQPDPLAQPAPGPTHPLPRPLPRSG